MGNMIIDKDYDGLAKALHVDSKVDAMIVRNHATAMRILLHQKNQGAIGEMLIDMLPIAPDVREAARATDNPIFLPKSNVEVIVARGRRSLQRLLRGATGENEAPSQVVTFTRDAAQLALGGAMAAMQSNRFRESLVSLARDKIIYLSNSGMEANEAEGALGAATVELHNAAANEFPEHLQRIIDLRQQTSGT